MLLSEKVDCNRINKEGQTPLMLLRKRRNDYPPLNNSELESKLIDAGAVEYQRD